MIHTVTVKFQRVVSVFLFCVLLFLVVMPAMSVKASAETSEKGSRIIVSLGDSYSSGEGIEDFYDQHKSTSEKVQSQDWLAHRSEKSWGGLLKLDGVKGTMADNRCKDYRENCAGNWFFVASSGATTWHLNNPQQKKYDKDGIKGSREIYKQLEVFEYLKRDGKNAEYITLTLGGNDVYFKEVVIEAALPHPFNPGALNQKLTKIWDEFYNGKDGELSIREKIKQAYTDIHNAAGEQAKIIVAGYPKLLEPSGSGGIFSENEATLINDSVSRFNKEIHAIVNSCKTIGMKICFVSVEEKFEGGAVGASKGKELINGIKLTQSEDLEDGKLPPISNYSFHPNDKGAQVYANCVQDKIDEIEKDAGKSEWPTMSTSDERDIVMVLDVSGSMSGTPIDETKKASEKFINTILQQDASIGIVAYDNQANIMSNFNMNGNYLTNIISDLNAGGETNIEAGLSNAYDMLKSSNAKKKIIVLMSDGEPNNGKVGDELIEYAETIKDDGVYIYTLGFFESLGGGKSSAQVLMENIASEGCHYEVANADDLVFFFGDIADQLNGQKYIYIRIACPTDVIVKYDGETLCSSDQKFNDRTSFGTLTLEDIEDSDEKIKTLRLKEGANYDIKIEGTGRGRMNYTIGYMDDNGEYTDFRKFKSIPITKKTVIDTTTKYSSKTVLNVDEDGDGHYDSKYRAEENGIGELVDYTYVYYIVIGAISVLVVLIVTIIIIKKIKKRKVN